MSEEQNSKSNWGGCFSIFILLAIIGYIGQKCETDSCAVCGDYTYKYYVEESAFSDSDISDMVGADRVDEYKQKLKSEAGMIYAMTIDSPEELDEGGIRGEIVIGIQTRNMGDVIYKGKLITTPGEEEGDGIVRIEYRYNDFLSKYEQITFNKAHNLLSFKIEENGLRFRNENSTEFGLSTLDGDLFVKD